MKLFLAWPLLWDFDGGVRDFVGTILISKIDKSASSRPFCGAEDRFTSSFRRAFAASGLLRCRIFSQRRCANIKPDKPKNVPSPGTLYEMI